MFTSAEFAEFLQRNGIRHVWTPPYHPASNGLVEKMVQTFKERMKRLKQGLLNTRLSRFLFKYRLTPHSTTGALPAEMIFGRKLRSPLDCLKPCIGRTVNRAHEQQRKSYDARAQAQVRDFGISDRVYASNFGPGVRWLLGVVKAPEGAVLFEVQLDDGRTFRQHADQLHHRYTARENVEESVTDPPSPPDVPEIAEDNSPGEEGSQELAIKEPMLFTLIKTQPPALASVPAENERPRERATTDQELEDSESRGTVQSQTNPNSTPTLRRSTCESRPPDQYGQHF